MASRAGTRVHHEIHVLLKDSFFKGNRVGKSHRNVDSQCDPCSSEGQPDESVADGARRHAVAFVRDFPTQEAT